MARVTSPLPPEQWPAGAALLLSVKITPAGAVAQRLPPPRDLSPAELLALSVKQREAATAWAALAYWKRFRWSLCARRQGIPANPPDGFIGWSGYTLYLACWRGQNVTPGKQPISPCSRRIVDPAASPFDFTP